MDNIQNINKEVPDIEYRKGFFGIFTP